MKEALTSVGMYKLIRGRTWIFKRGLVDAGGFCSAPPGANDLSLGTFKLVPRLFLILYRAAWVFRPTYVGRYAFPHQMLTPGGLLKAAVRPNTRSNQNIGSVGRVIVIPRAQQLSGYKPSISIFHFKKLGFRPPHL